MRVMERDIEILAGLFRYGALERRQIHELYFPGVALRRVNRRLKELVNAGLIVGATLPIGSPADREAARNAGCGIPFYYQLTTTAAPLVTSHLGVDCAQVRRRARTATAGRLVHVLTVADVAIALHRIAKRGVLAVKEIGITSEVYHAYDVKSAAGRGGWRREIFKPDLYARIACPQSGMDFHYFIEADLGNTSREEWAKKLAIAARYRDTGLFTRRYGAAPERFRLLVLTSGEKRREYLRRLARQESAAFCRFASLTTFLALP